MKLESILRKIDFVNRYKRICENHNDFENSMSGNQSKLDAEILQRIDRSAIYLSKDKSFKSSFSYSEFTLELILTLHSGHVQVHLNYLKNGEWLEYDRFDGYAEKLDPNFNTEIYNIPKYVSIEELTIILNEIFAIYEDIKKEFLKEVKHIN